MRWPAPNPPQSQYTTESVHGVCAFSTRVPVPVVVSSP